MRDGGQRTKTSYPYYITVITGMQAKHRVVERKFVLWYNGR